MTELMPYQSADLVRVDSLQNAAIQRLGEWANSADAAHRIAATLVQTSFCPEQFRNKAGEATAAILAGLEVGLQPMAALRSFDIINNQAAPRAITLRAIVQSFGHEMVLVESNATRCKMKGRRRGSSEWSLVTWTIERAQQMNLTNKANWKSQPQAMLTARATSELARLIASDAILGIGYSAEEIADGGNPEQQTSEAVEAPATSGTRKMSRRPKPANEDGSPAPDVEGQMKALHASFNEAGITERQDRLDFAMSIVNREITSSNDLTWDERGQVIDALKDRLENPFELEAEQPA